MQIKVIGKESLQTALWSGGTTTQLYIYPEDADYKRGDFQARISSATVEVDKSDFTSLPGVKRYLMIFNGHLEMIHGTEDKVVLEPYEVDEFDGGVPTVSYGKVTDFNLMLKNGADGVMEALFVEPEKAVTLPAETEYDLLILYVKEGALTVNGVKVEQGALAVCTDTLDKLELVSEEKTAKIGICKVKKSIF